MYDKNFVSMDQMPVIVSDLVSEIDEAGISPKVIIAISKGGLIPATMISYYYDCPIVTYDPVEDCFSTNNDISSECIIVDDVIDTGNTVNSVISLLEDEFFFTKEDISRIRVASIFATRNNTIVDFYHDEISYHDSVSFEFKQFI